VARTAAGTVEDDEVAAVAGTVTTRRVDSDDVGGGSTSAGKTGVAAAVDAADTVDRSVGTEINTSSPSETTRRLDGWEAVGAAEEEEEN